MNEELVSTIREIIADQIGSNTDQIEDSLTLRDNGTDSIDDVEIVMKIEEVFEIDISDEEADKIEAVRDIFTLVEEKK